MMLYWVLRCEELPKQSWVISNCIKNKSENSIHRRHPFVFRSNNPQLPTTPSSTPVDKKTHRGARHLHQSTNPKSLPPSRPGSVPLHSMKKFYRRCKLSTLKILSSVFLSSKSSSPSMGNSPPELSSSSLPKDMRIFP
jgi:hypothetical protein